MIHVGYYNGEIAPLEELKIPVLDRAVYFGDGCYDASTFANNHIFGKKDHFDRFYNSCRLLDIPFSMSREELSAELQKVIDAFDDDHGFIYWQVSRGTGIRSHQYTEFGFKPNLMIMATPNTMTPMDVRYKLHSIEDKRFFYCNIKTLNLLPNVLACDETVEAGCQETVFYRQEFGKKRVTECAHSNVLMLKDGCLIAPPRDNLILPGITLKHLLMLAQQNGIPTKETPFTLEELADADEVIVSSSGSLCTPASELDGKSVGGKDPKNLQILQNAYLAYYAEDTK